MRAWRTALGVGVGLATFAAGGLAMERASLPSPREVELGDVRVSIHLPVYNEEGWIEETLRSLVNQPLYKRYKFLYREEESPIRIIVLDSCSTDNTVEIAKRYADAVLEVPRGKLNARHAGIEWDDADIVVAVDAGDFYPEGWLSTLLEPFSDPDVVATHGSVLSRDPLYRVPTAWFNLVRPRRELSGRNSAFRTWAYWEVGGFDLSVNQLDRRELQIEEEFRFLDKLKKVGRVEFVWKAGMIKNERERPLTFEGDGRIEKYRREIAPWRPNWWKGRHSRSGLSTTRTTLSSAKNTCPRRRRGESSGIRASRQRSRPGRPGPGQ